MKNVGKKIKRDTKRISCSAFTREVLINASSQAIQQASKQAMDTSGYVVVAEEDWVVRIYKDGHRERISRIEPIKRPQSIKLD